jgi:DNA primase
LHATREAIKKEDKAVVVEGEFDLLSSFQAGVANVVAIKGSALTDGQLLLIKRYTQNITLALDSDFAGSQAARRGIEIAEGMGFNIAVVSLPVGKDPAECIEKGAHLWKKAVESASSIYDFVINLACGKYDKNEAIGKKKIGEEVIPFLGKIVNPIVQSHYIKYLANLLTVSEESIAAAIRTVAKKEAVAVVLPTTPVTTPREEMLEEYLLSLIVQNPDPSEVFAGVMNKIVLDDFYVSPVRKIVEQLILYFKKHKKLNVSVFTQVLTSEIIPTFDRAFMQDIAGILANSQTLQRELDFTAKEVKKAALRRTINNLSTKIRQLEDKGQEIEVKKASEQIRQAISSMRALEKDGASS